MDMIINLTFGLLVLYYMKCYMVILPFDVSNFLDLIREVKKSDIQIKVDISLIVNSLSKVYVK